MILNVRVLNLNSKGDHNCMLPVLTQIGVVFKGGGLLVKYRSGYAMDYRLHVITRG